MTSLQSRADRPALLAVLAALGAVPVASGGMLLGPTKTPGGSETTPSLDSEYRFVNTFWAAGGIALWWSLRQPEKRAAVTRLVLIIAAIGGIPRLISLVKTGAPHPVFRAALVLELVIVPAVLVWHGSALRGK